MPARLRILRILAFAAIYGIWGSTFLAIRVAVGTLPPLLMAGTRVLVAGAALSALARLRGPPAATGAEWWAAGATGSLLFGTVVLAVALAWRSRRSERQTS